MDTGSAALASILAFHEVPTDPAQLFHEIAPPTGICEPGSLILAARRRGLKADIRKTKFARLEHLPLPALTQLEDGTYMIVAKATEDKVLVQVPGASPQALTREDFEAKWDGKLLMFAKRTASLRQVAKFSITWFLPVMMRYRGLFGEVLLASLFLQLFGLITPLFFQVVIDKVLVHQGLTTLNVLIIALIAMVFFEAVLGYLRTYIFSHTTSRVDAILGSKLFSHLVALPISYFENRPTGQTVARVRELENVREFITGNALTVFLDFIFGLIFFWVMYLFSPLLTAIVAASIPFYVILSILITPSLKARIEDRFQKGARNQAFLVESISGAETLKSMAVEPQMKRQWDDNLAAYVRSSFRAIALNAAGSQGVQFINRLVTALILFFGAKAVMTGDGLTVGQLVAFNMLAGQISQPILRLANLWQDFQQFRISIDKLGDVLNTKAEIAETSVPENLPPIKGQVQFQGVTFRYDSESPEVLKDLSIDIEEGEMIGIVGRSGSGKSTITKLVQRLYVPDQGQVLIDGTNIGLLHPAWLRRQVSVVLQENVLFNRTIRQNIALADPAYPMERIIQAAQLAGAHDFILELPQGYDTVLEERGSNLSGGQRQRIAIARALITNPRILIFDEATSALDYESERIVHENMARIAKGRTVIVVAHRLSAVREANRILVMEKGKLIEQGPHEELAAAGGAYAQLLNQAGAG